MMPQMHLVSLVDKITRDLDEESPNESIVEHFNEFIDLIGTFPNSVMQCTLPILLSPFFALHSKREVYQKFFEETKLTIISTLEDILTKTKLGNEKAFALLYDFLLVQIYNHRERPGLSEELKLAILNCFNTLFSAMSWDLFPEFYTERHVPKLCVLLHECSELAKVEKARLIRTAALECILRLAKVDDDSDLSDVTILEQIASILIRFLPGIASRLIVIAVEDDKCGQKIVSLCVKTWGRLVGILMRDYACEVAQEKLRLEDLFVQTPEDEMAVKYKGSDEKLALCADLLKKLTTYDHPKVRKELVECCNLLLVTCFATLPKTISKLLDVLIILSQDSFPENSQLAAETLNVITLNLIETNPNNIVIIENLQENFLKHVSQLPRIFNGLDTREQIRSLNLLNGYLVLFVKSDHFKQVLFTQVNLNRLMESLLLIGELEKSGVSLLEEYALHDWESSPDRRTPWKTFKFTDSNKEIQVRIEQACHLLVQPIVLDIVMDYLLDVYHQESDKRLETILIINEILSVNSPLIEINRIKEIINLYLDIGYWELALVVNEKTSLKQVQNNIIQICLQLEGLGKIALVTNTNFEQFLLKVLYPVLEKAGSSHPLLRAAGLSSIANISKGCGYESITTLINRNADFFANNVINRLRKPHQEGVLNVLAVAMNYGNMQILQAISDVVDGVLMTSFDTFQDKNPVSYLHVFAIFIKSMRKWFGLGKSTEKPLKTKKEQEDDLERARQEKYEELKNFSEENVDEVEKTVEEMYLEDIEKTVQEEQDNYNCEEFKKPEPPHYIKLIVNILQRALNFLPAKQDHCKILVLEILNQGVEVLQDYEDELLPIVHKIWSPLVNRFNVNDTTTPLIANLSFQLLRTLGRLSKDFIRIRCVKEVLPALNNLLIKQSRESYLKDKGSAYRYTQGYKMQQVMLGGLWRLCYDLDLDNSQYPGIIPGVSVYLSDKQPLPLQEDAVDFFRQAMDYDCVLGGELIKQVTDKYADQIDWHKNLKCLDFTIVP